MILQLDTENADRDLTSQVTVLTHTPSTSNPMKCVGLVEFGDGTKNLDGTGGDFELTVTVDGQTVQPDPQSITFSTAVRASVWTTEFPVPANAEVVLKAKSPNAADTDVDVTAYLYDASTVDVIGISGDTTAADNLESQYDGTGLNGDTYPSTQSQLDAIANVGSAINTSATSDSTVTTGTTASGTYASTEALDGVTWQINDAAGTTDMYFEFDVGAVGVPTSAKWTGRLLNSNDTLDVFAYNWSATSWVQVGTVIGKNTTTLDAQTFDLFTSQVGTGANEGKVRIRFYGTGLTTSTFYTDQIFCSYTQAGSVTGYANGQIWVDTNNGTSGAVKDVNGVADNPVDNWTDALALSSATGLTSFYIVNGSSITLSSDSTNYSMIGNNWTIALNGQTISGMYIYGAAVTGTGLDGGANPRFEHCTIGDASLPACDVDVCGIAGTFTCTEAGTYYFDRCYSGVAGTGTPVLDFGSAVGSTNINFRHYSGGIDIRNMGQTGTDKMSLEGWGQYVLNANCVGGELAVRGHFKKTDNSGGAVTISDDANFKTNVIAFGNAQAATENTITLSTTASASDGAYDPAQIFIVSGTGAGQTRLILEYNGTTKVAVVDRNWKTTPDTTSEYRVSAHPGREHVNEGLAQAATSTTITLNALASSADDNYKFQQVFIRSGTGEDQVRIVTAYNGATKVATVESAWDVTPDATSGYVMLPQTTTTCDHIADCVWDEDITTHSTADTAGLALKETLVLRKNRLEFDLVNSKAYIWDDAGDARLYVADLTDSSGDPVSNTTQGAINCSQWTEV